MPRLSPRKISDRERDTNLSSDPLEQTQHTGMKGALEVVRGLYPVADGRYPSFRDPLPKHADGSAGHDEIIGQHVIAFEE